MRTAGVLAKLVFAHNVKHWARALLGVAGIAVSVCLVVWILRAYDSVAQGAPAGEEQEVGRFQVAVAPPMPEVMPGGKRGRGPRPQAGGPGGRGGPERGPGPGPGRGPGQGPGPGGAGPRRAEGGAPQYVDPGFVEELRRDPEVALVVPAVRTRVRVVDPPPAVALGPFGGGMLMGTPDAEPPRALGEGAWLQPGSLDEAVVSAAFARRYSLALGSELTVGGVGGEARLKVVGLLAASPGEEMVFFSPSKADLYVSLPAAERVNGFKDRVNVVSVALRDTEGADEFIAAWAARGASAATPVQLRSLSGKGDDPMGGRMLGMIALQAQNATVLAFLAACFIIFTTLSTSMRERLRELASLRAIALGRGQLAAMIFLEALLFGLAGWGLGLALARALLGLGNALAVSLRFFQAGAFSDSPLGTTSVIVSGAAALAGSLTAAAWPALQAARLKPLDVLSGQQGGGPARLPWVAVGLGLVLVVLNPLAAFLSGVEPFNSFFAKTYTMGFGPPLLGCVATIVGLVLLTPGFVRLVEASIGPLVAWALRLDPRFLRQQLSGNLWRTVGTTVSLSAGLTLFATALIWGYSMLVPFTPDESLPRMLVSLLPAGVPESAIEEVASTPGVVADDLLPMAVEQPRLSAEALASKPFATVDPAQQHVLLMGVDPQRAFAREDPVLGFTFVHGDRASAARLLRAGHYCLVPQHFATQTGLGKGDRFSVEVPGASGRTVEYEIAGVVYVPGWNWFTKFSEIRRRAGRALAVVFADYQQVKADFGIDRISFFWMNAEPGVGFEEMERRLGPVADRHAGVQVDVPSVGEALVSKQYVRITERGDLIRRLFQRADDVIWSLTRFPLLALIIASLALFNTIFASVRARYWQFGVLRGVGLSRWQLFRLILSESLMVFVAAGMLSLLSGVLLAWSGIRITTHFFFFAGHSPALVLPWAGLSVGFGIAFGLSLLAGLIPAAQAARKEPLAFIQAGRMAQ